MQTLEDIINISIVEPDTSTLEEIQKELSRRVHVAICFHECHWAESVTYTSNILYTRILIIAGVKTVLVIVKCPVCNTVSFVIYEYVETSGNPPYLYGIYRAKLETVFSILNFFKQYSPHISEIISPRTQEVQLSFITSSVRTCNKYLLLTLTNYYTYLLIKNKQKYKLQHSIFPNPFSVMQYCTHNTPTSSPIQKILTFISCATNRSSITPALLYYLLTIPSISLDNID